MEPDAKPLSIRQNFSWTMAGNVAYNLCQWGIYVVLAKAGDPAMVGQFAIGFALTAPLIIFFNLSLRSAQATDNRQEYAFGHYLALRLLTNGLFLLTVAGTVFFSHYRTETILVILGIGAFKCLESVSDVLFGRFQQFERMDLIAKSMTFKGIASLLFLGIGLVSTGHIYGGTIGLILSPLLILLAYDLPNALAFQRNEGTTGEGRSLNPIWDKRHLIQLAVYTLPLGFSQMLISLNANVSRYFLEKYHGEYLLGIFAAQASLILAGNQIVNALGQSCIPRLSSLYAANRWSEFKRMLYALCGIGLAIGLLGWFVSIAMGRFLLRVLFSAEYADYADVLHWLMLSGAAIFAGSFLGYGITATRRFSSFLVPYIVLLGVITMASWLLIPRFGMLGAAWVQGVSGIGYCIAPLFIFMTIRRRSA